MCTKFSCWIHVIFNIFCTARQLSMCNFMSFSCFFMCGCSGRMCSYIFRRTLYGFFVVVLHHVFMKCRSVLKSRNGSFHVCSIIYFINLLDNHILFGSYLGIFYCFISNMVAEAKPFIWGPHTKSLLVFAWWTYRIKSLECLWFYGYILLFQVNN